ncbi:hypothetical protein AKJ16_DCAP02838 [Drosera capensis]
MSTGAYRPDSDTSEKYQVAGANSQPNTRGRGRVDLKPYRKACMPHLHLQLGWSNVTWGKSVS